MSKPTDVSQEAWDAAIELGDLIPSGEGSAFTTTPEDVARTIMTAIARAISAEREGCAMDCEEEAARAKRNRLPHVALGARWCAGSIRLRGEA